MLKYSEWGEFKLGDLFEFEAIKQAKSQKLIPTDNSENGVPYIIQSTRNNMFSRNVNRDWLIENNESPVSGNRIVLGVTLPAVSYQPKEFGASQVITAKADWLNEKRGIFMATAISKLMYLFSYNNKPGIEIYKNLKIQLPTRRGEIDFDFMEQFVTNMAAERIDKLEKHLSDNGLSDFKLTVDEQRSLDNYENVEWGEFEIGKLFERLKTKKIPYKAKELPNQSTGEFTLPCLTSSFINQGLNYFVPEDEVTVLKNVISIPSNSDVYKAYFQSNEFTVLSDAYAIDWIYSDNKLSPNQYLFAVQCINKITDLPIYSYKNKLGGWNVVKGKIIQLPIKNNEPDYELMESLISAIKKLIVKNVIAYIDEKKKDTINISA